LSGRHQVRGRTAAITAMLFAMVLMISACAGKGGSEPATQAMNDSEAATYEYVIPAGAGEALDAGAPLEILPAKLEVQVGESIRIINEDNRGHSVGPFFVGANETLSQRFSSPGEFAGVCTVHPSGEFALVVRP
jgi:plastocyanin